MSLEAYIDIRFADPVLSMSLNHEALVYGSAIGRLLYYNFETQEEKVIKEISEECIRGVWMSPDSTVFIAVGDLKCVVVSNVLSPNMVTQVIHHQRVHSISNCPFTHVVQSMGNVCIMVLEPQSDFTSFNAPAYSSSLYVTNLNSQTTRDYNNGRFPLNSVPLDFDGDRLLWIEWKENNERFLHIFFMNLNENRTIQSNLKPNQGDINFAMLLGDQILIIKDCSMIELFEISTGNSYFMGRSKSPVAAACAFIVQQSAKPRITAHSPNVDAEPQDNSAIQMDIEDSQNRGLSMRVILVTATEDGEITIYDNGAIGEIIRFSELAELTYKYQHMKYFSMGYPYVIATHRERIAVSTDLGVLVLKSSYLESICMCG